MLAKIENTSFTTRIIDFEMRIDQTRLKLENRRIDIIYSGRGMPFRCLNIITEGVGYGRAKVENSRKDYRTF